MALKQLTVFVENKQGTIVSVTDILAKNNVNIRALSIAETEDFGILRLIVNDEATAVKTSTAKNPYFILLFLSDNISTLLPITLIFDTSTFPLS